ncbi:hypothetical protein [Methylobacterium aerolatum]|uniref:Uncharacterized protein n=1 Tax=Methylobacterium aerolatum TaxID=418708 RepID=A0ABU0HWY3_9HYPH|nr:hypothetical protein [Methylobacterium aerolatum]MDQ0445994.1 hypothetical protein [Methylobacterium aerolatum]GJD35031.1 hypothetical protein FMGBMHLM_1938 [Methylobacterium aerolatum]
MSTVVGVTSVTVVRDVRMPRGSAVRAVPVAAGAGGVIEDGYRYRALGSLQALGLAVAASAVLTGLLFLLS